jgi:hypothetical protein
MITTSSAIMNAINGILRAIERADDLDLWSLNLVLDRMHEAVERIEAELRRRREQKTGAG